LARERSKLDFNLDPRAMKIRAASKPWAGARGWRSTGRRKGQRGQRKAAVSDGNGWGSGVVAALAGRARAWYVLGDYWWAHDPIQIARWYY
jgi:hypothetical protein